MKAAAKIIGVVVALSLLGGIMAYLAGFFESKIPIDARKPIPTVDRGQVFAVEATAETLIEQAPGTIRAKVETIISPVITATISSIAVRAGDVTRQGEVLVELDARELDARLDQAQQAVVAAEARLAQAEKDFERVQRIMSTDPGAVSRAELDRTQAALRTARADHMRTQRQRDEMRTSSSYSVLTSPISGRVVERYADPGDTARQGQPLLRIYDPSSLRLEASVRESVASKLAKGQQLAVKIDALDKQFPAMVDEIVPSADPGSRSFLVKVSLPGTEGLYPGMFGRLLIPIGQTERIYVPRDAVTHVGQLDFVVVKTEQGVIRRYVRLGPTAGDDRVQVISGLAPGEQILVDHR